MKHRRELWLLLGALVVSLLLAEVGLRLHYRLTYSGALEELEDLPAPAPGARVFLGQILKISDAPRLVYRMLPDLDVRFHGIALRTNSQGWREDEIPLAKPPGTIRVAGIGDSVMFGWKVREEQRYMDLLEAGLNEAHPRRRWETLTFAVPGYNLVMEAEAFERHGLEYSPDLLVVGFSVNDFCLPNFVVPRRSVWSLEPFLAHYLSRGRSAAPRLVRRLNVLLDGSEDGEVTGPRGAAFFDTYCSPANVPRELRHLVGPDAFLNALRSLVRLGRDRGVPVVFLHHGIGQGYVPLGEPDDNTSAEIVEALAALRDIEGLVVADLTGDFHRIFDRVDPTELVIGPTDPHPSPRGHRQIARLFQRFLHTAGLLRALEEGSASPTAVPARARPGAPPGPG